MKAHLCGHEKSRREFLSSCAGYTLAALAASTSAQRRAYAAENVGEVVTEAAFARIEKLADGVWAAISTPAGRDFTTLSNGGIIAGKDGVLVIEGFMNPKGASWLAGAAKELTGHAPTHVALTHFHGDHVSGLSGYFENGASPKVAVTKTTSGAMKTPPEHAEIIGESSASTIDLGGRTVRITPRLGHTASDITIEIDGPEITWCGDLLWNGFFPNYVDAIPSKLNENCLALFSDAKRTYVPGHGSIPDAARIAQYAGLLLHIEAFARKSHADGKKAEDAAKEFTVPDSLGEWAQFQPNFYRTALMSWEKELG